MRISDWSSDVCSSDLVDRNVAVAVPAHPVEHAAVHQPVDLFDQPAVLAHADELARRQRPVQLVVPAQQGLVADDGAVGQAHDRLEVRFERVVEDRAAQVGFQVEQRSEEHTSELQSLMRISYAVFCLKKKKKQSRQLTKQ